MNKILSAFIVFTAVPFVLMSSSNASGSDQSIVKILKKNGISDSHLSLYASVLSGKGQEILVDINSKKMLVPASISKLATTAAVLKNFLPGTKFKTQLLSDGKVEESALKGNLYLKGGGDPSFISENMWYLVNHFLRTGIKKIEGDIIVDDSLFDKERFDDSRQPERVDRAYDAPVGAMSFNWNSINIFIRPSLNKGGSADVFLDPQNDYTSLENKAKTAEGSENSLAADRKEDKGRGGDQIFVTGKIGRDIPEHVIYKNITHPDLWSGSNLKGFLGQRGVTISGGVKSGKTPDSAKVLGEYESKPIQNILADMNKFSNNYVAEMLTKNLGSLFVKPATLASGMKVILDHLKDIGVPSDQYQLQNPSGLTRDNKISSFAMWKILMNMKEDFRIYPEMLTSLPIAGIDGTLKKRMKDSPGERWVRAKTGFLTNVVSLAGFAGRKDGTQIVFSFIFNGQVDEGRVRRTFDDILIHLIEKQ